MGKKIEQIRELLVPLIHEETSRIGSFLEDDMEGYIGFVEACQIEDKVLAFLRSHPNASAQELYHLIPEDNSSDYDEDDD